MQMKKPKTLATINEPMCNFKQTFIVTECTRSAYAWVNPPQLWPLVQPESDPSAVFKFMMKFTRRANHIYGSAAKRFTVFGDKPLQTEEYVFFLICSIEWNSPRGYSFVYTRRQASRQRVIKSPKHVILVV